MRRNNVYRSRTVNQGARARAKVQVRKKASFGCAASVTVCPGSSDPIDIVTYYIKWVTTSWTHSNLGWIQPQ